MQKKKPFVGLLLEDMSSYNLPSVTQLLFRDPPSRSFALMFPHKLDQNFARKIHLQKAYYL